MTYQTCRGCVSQWCAIHGECAATGGMLSKATAFKQQEAMGKDVPKWIIRRRNELLNGADPHRDDYRSDYAAIVSNAVEAFIAAHEQPPVDWLAAIIEAAQEEGTDIAQAIRARIPNIDSLAAAGEGGAK